MTKIYEQLRIQTAKQNLCVKEKAHQIISQTVKASESISDVFRKYFGQDNGINLDIPVHDKPYLADL